MTKSCESISKEKFYSNVILLNILYTLQGFPLGIADIFPYIIQTLGASYKDLAWFSITSWPFSLKIIWAPIVEAIYIKRIGRRKTWIVVTQLAIGLALIVLSFHIDFYFSNLRSNHVLNRLVILFTFTIFLAATQDIAVDGWGLNLFPRSLVSWASLCNTVGQTVGYIIGNIIFLLLTSPINLPFVKTTNSLVKESTFLFYSGIVFIVITISVLIFKKEKKEVHSLDIKKEICNSYNELFQFMKMPHMIQITIIILTLRFAYAASDSLVYPKLIENGLKKEDFAFLNIPLILVQISVSLIANQMMTNRNPVKLYMKIFWAKMSLVVLSIFLIYYIKLIADNRIKFLGVITAFSVIHNIVHYFHYTALMYFFSLIIDPKYAGSQLTYLNTVNNLAFKWPHTLVLYMVDFFNIKTCTDSLEATTCKTTIDGFYIVSLICIIAGILWYYLFRKTFISVSKDALKNVNKYLNKND